MSDAYSGMNSRDRLALALHSSFLLPNDYEEKNKALTMLKSELYRRDTSLFSVAFVT